MCIPILRTLLPRQPAKHIINLSRLTYVSYVVPRQEYLRNRLSQVGEQAFPEAHKPTLSYCCKCLEYISTSCFSAGRLDELSTCIRGRCFGLFSTSILRNPTAMAPEETMTTRCPSLMRATAVSTMRERTDSRGSCVFSLTIELEPVDDV